MNPLARIAYNMIAEGGEAAARSSGDDVLKAAAKIADEGVKVADDWGWKGGKPGEITGREYMRNLDIEPESLLPRLKKDFDVNGLDDADLLMNWFADLEEADVPRKWTGKIAKKMWGSDSGIPLDDSNSGLLTVFKDISKYMRPMSNADRTTLVSMLPNWERTVSDLPSTVKALKTLSSDQRETFMSLLPEWSGSIDDLAELTRTI